ncbi:hypothetical protein [Paractinoplanes atraurantiacus]|uniref:Uncharacterized protein n=1 Tax=Paractinoplanes atraurantiacus TaxID=1036182 RepID=A0A285IYR1_9ACTN|nr:hypothetical protein [Actinoplanes atraurantiacus]SNY53185.1 hypothetical protein SAMN05421748_113205 [Actinoplanes atraurantiacus]
MGTSQTVISVGAVCFGMVVGFVTYRSLARSGPTSSVSDIAAVVGVVGGGVVTSLFDPTQGDAFGWYAIGLVAGMALYPVVVLTLGKKVSQDSGGSVLLGSDSDPSPE